MNNPFTLSFGKEPTEYISRLVQTENIIETFSAEQPSNQTYMITGVRGSGKTVFLSNIAKRLRDDERWIVVELNSDRDMLESFASKLYSNSELQSLFFEAKLDFSAFGLGVSVKNGFAITDIETAISKMLEKIKEKNKRVMIAIDEVVVNQHMKIFASAYQIFVRQDYPVFLLMTGLYENLYNLQNEKTLTFLYRTPKIHLEPLNLNVIRQKYMMIFSIDSVQASYMTNLTKGYPFAFQVLGYLMWENKESKDIDEIIPLYEQYLIEYVYEKIWSELSELDRRILAVFPDEGEVRIIDIREKLDITSGKMAVYRDRLIKKGLVDSSHYGYLSLSLPRFAEFMKVYG